MRQPGEEGTDNAIALWCENGGDRVRGAAAEARSGANSAGGRLT